MTEDETGTTDTRITTRAFARAKHNHLWRDSNG